MTPEHYLRPSHQGITDIRSKHQQNSPKKHSFEHKTSTKYILVLNGKPGGVDRFGCWVVSSKRDMGMRPKQSGCVCELFHGSGPLRYTCNQYSLK